MQKKRNKSFLFLLRATSRTRTGDLRITNALLYQLSQSGNKCGVFAKSGCKGTAFF